MYMYTHMCMYMYMYIHIHVCTCELKASLLCTCESSNFGWKRDLLVGVGTNNVHICCCYHSRVHEQATLRLHLQLYLFMQCISRPNTSTTMTREQKREEQREDKDNLYNTSPLNNKLLTIIILLTTFLLGTQPADVIGFNHAIHCGLRPPVHVCQSHQARTPSPKAREWRTGGGSAIFHHDDHGQPSPAKLSQVPPSPAKSGQVQPSSAKSS